MICGNCSGTILRKSCPRGPLKECMLRLSGPLLEGGCGEGPAPIETWNPRKMSFNTHTTTFWKLNSGPWLQCLVLSHTGRSDSDGPVRAPSTPPTVWAHFRGAHRGDPSGVLAAPTGRGQPLAGSCHDVEHASFNTRITLL